MLNVLIPSFREPKRVNRLIQSLNKIAVPYKVHIVRNFDEEPYIDFNHFAELAKDSDFQGVVEFNSSNNLGDLYKQLYDTVQDGEYFIFLEDDDYLNSGIRNSDLKGDIILNRYVSFDLIDGINWSKALDKFLDCPEKGKEALLNIEAELNPFQISCFIAKKKPVTITWDNELNNDWKLFRSLLNQATIEDISVKEGVLFIQDVQDNISFPKYNIDPRWETS